MPQPIRSVTRIETSGKSHLGATKKTLKLFDFLGASLLSSAVGWLMAKRRILWNYHEDCHRINRLVFDWMGRAAGKGNQTVQRGPYINYTCCERRLNGGGFVFVCASQCMFYAPIIKWKLSSRLVEGGELCQVNFC